MTNGVCRYCRATLRANARFCPNCGAQNEVSPADQTSKTDSVSVVAPAGGQLTGPSTVGLPPPMVDRLIPEPPPTAQPAPPPAPPPPSAPAAASSQATNSTGRATPLVAIGALAVIGLAIFVVAFLVSGDGDSTTSASNDRDTTLEDDGEPAGEPGSSDDSQTSGGGEDTEDQASDDEAVPDAISISALEPGDVMEPGPLRVRIEADPRPAGIERTQLVIDGEVVDESEFATRALRTELDDGVYQVEVEALLASGDVLGTGATRVRVSSPWLGNLHVPRPMMDIALRLADAISRHDWAEFRRLEPRYANKTDAEFASYEDGWGDVHLDTVIAVGVAGPGLLDVGLVAQQQRQNGRRTTSVFCMTWSFDVGRGTANQSGTGEAGRLIAQQAGWVRPATYEAQVLGAC